MGRKGPTDMHLSLETNAQPDVLVRVLSLLRRRGCRILAVDFRQADRHRPGRLDVTVIAPPRVAHCLERWLLGLVDVTAVQVLPDRAPVLVPAAA
jgi:acetolactate synthase regulatory subunit